MERGTPSAFYAWDGDHRLLIPLVVRPVSSLREGWARRYNDAVSPYGFGSPIYDGRGDARGVEFLDRAFRLFVRRLREAGIVAAFIRLHPLMPIPHEPLRLSGTVILHGESVSIDLRLPDRTLWNQMRKGHRYEIRKSEREGVDVSLDVDEETVEQFIDIYYETMQRRQASPYYYFGRTFFYELFGTLGERLFLCTARRRGEVLAGALFSEHAGIIQYLFAGSRDGSIASLANKRLVYYMMQMAKTRGNRVLHLGGGVGSAYDGLCRFKTGFSRLTSPFHTWRVVADWDAYLRLVATVSGRDTEGNLLRGYFPAYRSPSLARAEAFPLPAV